MDIKMPERIKNNTFEDLIGCPEKGAGKRAFACDQYDSCLYQAAIADWESFNCEHCQYKAKGPMEFFEPIFTPEIDDDTADSTEIELIDLVFRLRADRQGLMMKA